MGRLPLGGNLHNAGDVAGVPFRFPGGVPSVAKPAPQIASAGSNKDARGAIKTAFALNTMKNFRDSDHALRSLTGFLPRVLGFYRQSDLSIYGQKARIDNVQMSNT